MAVTALTFTLLLSAATPIYAQSRVQHTGNAIRRTAELPRVLQQSPRQLRRGQVSAGPQRRSTRTVLAIFWSTEDFSSSPAVDAAIRDALRVPPGPPVDYFTEYLESDRFSEPRASLALRDYIRRKYAARPIDVVVANSDVALRFVRTYRRELFPDAPIVYLGLEAPSAGVLHAGAGLTGVVSGSGIASTLSLALQLHPAVDRVFIVAQAPDATLQASMRETVQRLPRKVELVYLTARPLARLLTSVKAVPARSLILFVRYSQEDAGQVLFPRDIARQVATASPVPVYGIVEGYLGSGIVGGALYAPDALGARIGEIAREILNGTPVHDIPLERATVVPTFDWRQLRRWRIDESRLPPGADVRFRTPSEWQTYRWYFLGTLSLVILQTALIASLLAHRRRRRRAEAVIGANEAALRTSYKRIRHLAGQLINAQEEARTRIARDLHDDVCQELAGVSIAVSNLKRWRRHLQDPPTQDALSTLQNRALGLIDRVRRLSHDLHPGMLRHAGLAGALEAYCIEIEQRYDVQVTFRAEGDLRHISDDAALCLFRIAQEALRNAATHGRARRMTVLASRTARFAELTVTDDGIGFDVEAVRHDGGGLGLLSIEERAYLADGRAHISTEPGKGTTVHVMVPSCARIEPERKAVEEDTDGHVPALLSAGRPGGRDELTQSPDRRRPQAVRRGRRATPQGSLRDCGHGRRREPAARGGLPIAP